MAKVSNVAVSNEQLLCEIRKQHRNAGIRVSVDKSISLLEIALQEIKDLKLKVSILEKMKIILQ